MRRKTQKENLFLRVRPDGFLADRDLLNTHPDHHRLRQDASCTTISLALRSVCRITISQIFVTVG